MDINQIDIQTIVSKVMESLGEDSKTQNSAPGQVPTMAKVAVLTEKQKLEIKEFQIPQINDDEVLVKVEGCGVCGTDVHEYKNDPFGLIPVVLGHEGTGTIVKLGKNVKTDIMGQPLKLGDKIVTSVTITEEDTFSKMHPEKANLSDHMDVYGLLPDDEYRFNGWFGEYIVLRKNSSIFRVNDMSLKERLLIEPAAVTVHAVERAKTTGLLKFNSMVLVQGCGPIGLMLLSVLRTMGIENILAVDGDNQRLKMAQRLGAKYTFNFKDFGKFDDMLAGIHKISGGGVDFAFQCTGVPSAASSIYKMIRRGGGLCEVGFFVDNGDATINPHFDLCQKEITLVGSWVYTFADYATTLDFIRRAKGIGLPIEELVTHDFALDELNEAMHVNMRLEGIKVAFVNK
ncbi:zinc-binding dehydrogenase [Vallitaleaceae bacterium 9-2]